MHWLKRVLFLLTTTVVFAPSIASGETATAHHPQLLEQPVVVEKSTDPLPTDLTSYLAERDGEIAKVWLFFTDKGCIDQTGFNSKASGVRLTDRASKRRRKVNLDRVVFADLPVEPSYLMQVVDSGGILRHQSRWLNAASFEIPMDHLDAISRMPFVAYIRPVATYVRPPVDLSTFEKTDDWDFAEPTLSETDLLYGKSVYQLDQINVLSAHEKGHNAKGVLLAIFDSGFDPGHNAYAAALADGRMIAKYDFVYGDTIVRNEPGEPYDPWYQSQEYHGTAVWSAAAGEWPTYVYGPAYKADFLLGKTEHMTEEYPEEEDNLVAGVEWADSIGADVITASLGYSDWYTIRDYDGVTSPCSIAFGLCASMGIVACNSMGNEGPNLGTLTPPADAFNILAVGAVDEEGVIANFSSRGPTYDGRTKPEVCARGIGVYMAWTYADTGTFWAGGTSYSTPLVAGVAALMVGARPGFTPLQIRQAMMETACNANSPNNDYGWGVVNADAAITWGPNFSADIWMAEPPFTVQFTGTSTLATDIWDWSFGDGATASGPNTSHEFTQPGVYDVSMTVETEFGTLTDLKPACVLALGDTLTFVSDSGLSGHSGTMSIHLTNTQPLDRIIIPFKTEDLPGFKFDSAALGERTTYFEELKKIHADPYWTHSYTHRLTANIGGGSPPLEPGSGEILKLYFTFDPWESCGTSTLIDTASAAFVAGVTSVYADYSPKIVPGEFICTTVERGDVDFSHQIDIADLVYMVSYAFNDGPPPVTQPSMDVNSDGRNDISDVVYMVRYQFDDGPPPL